MEVMAGFIVEFDTDPDDIFERQIEFIRKSAIPLAMVGLLNALPDTHSPSTERDLCVDNEEDTRDVKTLRRAIAHIGHLIQTDLF
jgi:hypothetical protein